MNKIIEKLKDKSYVRAFGLLATDEQECIKKVGKSNCIIYDGAISGWTTHHITESVFCTTRTYAIKPDYQPEPEETDSLIGKTVVVFDRYHFAVPLRGRIQDVAEKDGAYKVSFYSKQHGYPAYLQMDHNYFFRQQCQIIEDEPEYVDLEIASIKNRLGVFGDNRYVTIGDYGFVPLHELPSLPNFERFACKNDVRIGIEDVAARISDKKKVYARVRK